MPHISNVTIAGHLGADPETKDIGSNTVTNFSVAVSQGFGEKKTTGWYRCAAWGKRGKAIQDHLSKGDPIIVSGRLSQRTFGDNNERTSVEVEVQDWSFAGAAGVAKPEPESGAPAQAEFEDDIPF